MGLGEAQLVQCLFLFCFVCVEREKPCLTVPYSYVASHCKTQVLSIASKLVHRCVLEQSLLCRRRVTALLIIVGVPHMLHI